MKQLLIVNSTQPLNGGVAKPEDLSALPAGAIGFFALNDYSQWLNNAPETNFGIALGRGNNSPAFVIPEVDIDTLSVNIAEPADGKKFKAEITVPVTLSGHTYTLVLVKNGIGINGERNKWTSTYTIPTSKTKTAVEVAKILADQFTAMADSGSIDINVTVSGAKITIEGVRTGEQWTLKAADDLYSVEVTTTNAEPAVGDAAYIKDLASQCAAGKGFNYTDLESQHIYPGYPEAVEDNKYTVITLRFAVGRDASHQVDERVWQLVHIAVPSDASALSSIKSILTLEESGSGSGD